MLKKKIHLLKLLKSSRGKVLSVPNKSHIRPGQGHSPAPEETAVLLRVLTACHRRGPNPRKTPLTKGLHTFFSPVTDILGKKWAASLRLFLKPWSLESHGVGVGRCLFTVMNPGLWKWKLLSCVWLFVTPWHSPWNPPGQNTGVGSLSLLQGIFPPQRSNPGLPHCGWILNQLSHQKSPRRLEWVAIPSPADLPKPGIELGSPALQADSLPAEPPGKPILDCSPT